MDTMVELRRANVARDRIWSKGVKFTPSFRGNELGGECGEAQNILKKLDRERMGLVGSRSDTNKLADELADVIICCDLAAMDFGIDLRAAIARKFNKTSEKYDLPVRMEETI